MKHIFFITATALIPAGALAQSGCPVAGDIKTGIRVTMTDGGLETYKDLGGGRVENIVSFGADEDNLNILGRGIYLRSTSFVKDGIVQQGSLVTYNYPLPDAEMPLPVPGGAWNVEVVRLDNARFSKDLNDIRFGDQTRFTIGACEYDTIPVIATIGDTEDWYRETLYYLPELGFALYGKYEAKGEDEETYSFASIEAIKP